MAWTKIVALPLEWGILMVSLVWISGFIAQVMVFEEKYAIVKSLLLRGVALTAFCALYSFQMQAVGLFGDHGIYPLKATLGLLSKFLAMKDTWHVFSSEYGLKLILALVQEKFQTDRCSERLKLVLRIDLLAAAVAVIWPHPILFGYLYFSYYSFKRIAGPFLNFQWDALLLESLFLSIPLSMSCSHWMDALCIWLFRILLFRLMFGSGMVKAYGRDNSWHTDYSAMSFYFLTQPLPNYLGMLMHNSSSERMFQFVTKGTLVAEVCLPLLSLLNHPTVNVAVAIGYSGLMLSIAATGSYGFFNFLTIVLSVSLVSDAWFLDLLRMIFSEESTQTMLNFLFPLSYLSKRRGQVFDPFGASHRSLWSLLGQLLSIFINTPLIGIIAVVCMVATVRLLQRTNWVRNGEDVSTRKKTDEEPDIVITEEDDSSQFTVNKMFGKLCSLHEYMLKVFFIGNHYGLFATMTKERDELIIEVSADPNLYSKASSSTSTSSSINSDEASEWHMIHFRFKPTSLDNAPRVVWPLFHMPRLDWSMWFVALKPSSRFYPKWFWHFLLCILEQDPDDTVGAEVLQLLDPSSLDCLRSMRAQIRTRYREHLQHRRQVHAPPSNVSLNQQEENDAVVDGLLLRVRCGCYRFASSIPMKQLHQQSPEDENESVRKEGRYWTVTNVHSIVKPMHRDEILQVFESFDKSTPTDHRTSSRPSVETASEIIMRTLFKNMQSRRNKDDASRDSQLHSASE